MYNQLLETITKLVECGDRRIIKQINYRLPATIRNRHLVHDTSETNVTTTYHR